MVKYTKKNKFMLIDYHDYMSKNLMQFWDIGLRKFSIIFLNDNKNLRLKIKKYSLIILKNC